MSKEDVKMYLFVVYSGKFTEVNHNLSKMRPSMKSLEEFNRLKFMLRPALSVLLVIMLFGQGCFYREPVRHLASDVCMISEGVSQKEVLQYLGSPDERQGGKEAELWIYFQVNQTVLRKAPYIGDRLGREDVDVVTVRFAGDKVVTCVYRSMSEEEFRGSGIMGNDGISGR